VTDDPFDRLLDAMPKIAEAVNVVASPDVQRRAFATRQSRPSAPRWDDTGTKRCGTAASAHDSTEHGWNASRSDGYRPPRHPFPTVRFDARTQGRSSVR
jgi:hypothetical protein